MNFLVSAVGEDMRPSYGSYISFLNPTLRQVARPLTGIFA